MDRYRRGIYIYDYETEDIMPFVLATSKNIHIETNTNHIVEDKDKNLWFTTVGQGIFKYNTITNHLEQYEFKNANGLMAKCIWWIVKTKYGPLPIGETQVFSN